MTDETKKIDGHGLTVGDVVHLDPRALPKLLIISKEEADAIAAAGPCSEFVVTGPAAPRTLADELRAENARLQARFIHHTRPKRPLTFEEAAELARRVAGKDE